MHRELYDRVAVLARALRAFGVRRGDRVGGVLPNIAEAVIAMLATVSIGALWSSCSPDFGLQGVRDRFGQIEVRVGCCTSLRELCWALSHTMVVRRGSAQGRVHLGRLLL